MIRSLIAMVRLDLVQRRPEKPPTVTEASRKKVIDLRAKTETIYEELYQRKLLELSQQEHKDDDDDWRSRRPHRQKSSTEKQVKNVFYSLDGSLF
jgi:hypothetical protein